MLWWLKAYHIFLATELTYLFFSYVTSGLPGLASLGVGRLDLPQSYDYALPAVHLANLAQQRCSTPYVRSLPFK